MKSDEQLLAEIAEAARGLLLMSESDYPLEPFSAGPAGALTPRRLRQMAGADEAAPVSSYGFDEFFAAAAFVVARRDWGADAAHGDRILKLKLTLSDNLSGLRAYRVGAPNVAVFVLGTSPAGGLLGVRTRAVET